VAHFFGMNREIGNLIVDMLSELFLTELEHISMKKLAINTVNNTLTAFALNSISERWLICRF
jgi:hypothetical protein